MEYVNWPTNKFNSKFYGFNDKPKDNVTVTEFLSGRTIGRLNNTKNIMTISCSIRFSKDELKNFWNWYNNTLGQTAGYFKCAALGSNIYRFTDTPDPQDTDLKYRTLSLSIEEAL